MSKSIKPLALLNCNDYDIYKVPISMCRLYDDDDDGGENAFLMKAIPIVFE